MEPYFENVTVATQQFYDSLYKKLYANYRCKQGILMGAFLLVSLFLYWRQRSELYLVLVGLYVYLLLKVLLSHKRAAQKAYMNKLAYYDNTLPPATHRFYSGHFESRDVDAVTMSPYAKLRRVEYLPDIVILVRKDGDVYCLDTNAFTKGDYESFTRFLQEKTPHLNPAQKQ